MEHQKLVETEPFAQTDATDIMIVQRRVLQVPLEIVLPTWRLEQGTGFGLILKGCDVD